MVSEITRFYCKPDIAYESRDMEHSNDVTRDVDIDVDNNDVTDCSHEDDTFINPDKVDIVMNFKSGDNIYH